MAYRLIAVDVDGTLLDDNDRITSGTRMALKKAVENGTVLTICTGRPVQSARPLVEELGIDAPFITYNGAMVVKGLSGDIMYEQCLRPDDASMIYGLGQEYGTTVVVWSKNRLFANRLDDRAYAYGRQAKTQPELMKDPEKVFSDGATKILWYDSVKRVMQFQQQAGSRLDSNVNYHTSKPFYLEFVHSEASKAIALEHLGANYGINREEMIAVGDGHNDISMIKYAGLGVAMANAPDEVKQVADYITLSNNEDGLANVIEKFIFS